MSDYRVYPIDEKGHIIGPATVFTCDDDQEVALQAKSLINGHDLDGWEGSRHVGQIRSEARHGSV
jgi:hypothetical protein